MRGVYAQPFSRVQLFLTPWTVARQALLSMGFFRQESCSRLPFPPPGDLPHPGMKPASPALAGGFFTTVPPGKGGDGSLKYILVKKQAADQVSLGWCAVAQLGSSLADAR